MIACIPLAQCNMTLTQPQYIISYHGRHAIITRNMCSSNTPYPYVLKIPQRQSNFLPNLTKMYRPNRTKCTRKRINIINVGRFLAAFFLGFMADCQYMPIPWANFLLFILVPETFLRDTFCVCLVLTNALIFQFSIRYSVNECSFTC